MKVKIALSIIGLAFAPFALADSHDHGKHEKSEHGHESDKKQGPNQGKLIKDVEPHLEFLVTKDRKVKLTFVDDDNKVVSTKGAVLSMICGKRSKPTKISFTKTKTGFISDQKLPKGKNIPTILRVKPSAKGKTKTVRFNINLNDCPTCEFTEYNCTCDHGGHDDHDHGSHKGHDH